MDYGADFFRLISVFVLVLIAPGLDFAVVLRESLLYGRKNGLMTVCGVTLALMIHISYTILGLGLLVVKTPLLFGFIKYAGIAYLFYIGGRALLSKGGGASIRVEEVRTLARARSLRQAFLVGFTCNILNPKVILFFLSIFSVLIAAETPLIIKALDGLVIAFLNFTWFSCVVLFLTLPKVVKIYYGFGKWIDRISGVVFVALGLSLLWQKG